MKKFVLFIWQIAYKVFLKKRKNLKLGKKVYINRHCEFEGFNYLSNHCSIFDSHFGFGSYISERGRVKKSYIGKYSSIGPDFKTVFGNHPTGIFVSTHPAFYSTLKQIGMTYTNEQLFEEFKPAIIEGLPYTIKIGNDVWIGAEVMVMDGVKIGDGAIIAAGSVVIKDVEPYAIVGGVPAKLIKYRFTKDQIDFLSKFKWWEKDKDWIKENSPNFTDIEHFMKKFENGTV